jgi:hypothetical protein
VPLTLMLVLLVLLLQERGVWRARVLGVTAGGSGPEDLTDTVNNLLAYDGVCRFISASLPCALCCVACVQLLHCALLACWPCSSLCCNPS